MCSCGFGTERQPKKVVQLPLFEVFGVLCGTTAVTRILGYLRINTRLKPDYKLIGIFNPNSILYYTRSGLGQI